MQVSDDPRVGTLFAGYRLEGLLRRDGVGVLYLAEDARSYRRVALRLLNAELAADKALGERFLKSTAVSGRQRRPASSSGR